MDWHLLRSVTATSVDTIGELVVVGVAGVFLWRQGIINLDAISMLSKMNFIVLAPAMTLSCADAFSLKHLYEWSVLPLACFCHVLVASMLARLASRICGLHANEQQMVMMACGFHNCMGLPFIFITALSRSWPRISEDPDSLQRGYAMVFVYNLPWNMMVFSWGLMAIRAHIEDPAQYELDKVVAKLEASEREELSSGDNDRSQLQQHISSTSKGEQQIATVAPASPEAQPTVLEDINLDAMPVVTVGLSRGNEMVTLDSQELEVQTATLKARREGAICHLLWEAFRTWLHAPPTAALLLSLLLGAVVWLRGIFFGPAAVLGWVSGGMHTLGLAAVPVGVLILAANLARAFGLQQKNSAANIACAAGQCDDLADSPERLRMSIRAQLVLFVVKLLFAPLFFLCCTVALLSSGLLGKPSEIDPLLLMLLLIEPAMPSSQTLVSLYNVEGHADAATRLSSAYIPQYLGSILTMTVWVLTGAALVETYLG
jgi:predicted permease